MSDSPETVIRPENFAPDIRIIDAVFRARKPIRSLPGFHAARWSAWLRFACGKYGLPLEKALFGLVPLRNGARPVQSGELISLRLITGSGALAHLAAIVQIMTTMECHGQFSSATFEFVSWKDAISSKSYAPDAPLDGIARLTGETVAAEIAALSGLKLWTLHFYAPLRLKKPAGYGKSRCELYSFCRPGFFSSATALLHLCSKVRMIKNRGEWFDESSGKLPEIVSQRLVWRDMRYNEARRVALGGVTGKITCSGPMARNIAERLVLGQYLGAGKNPLFGLGYWHIPEISHARIIDLPYLL